jgi:uncharacterized protein YutE (UPF0331/DUF86 family)
VDAARLQRYADKLAHVDQRLAWYDEWARDAAKDARSRLASYKALQEAIEAFVDVAAMVVLDSARGVKDDATNLAVASDAGAFAKALLPGLRELNALRNVLVHEYDGIDQARADSSAQRLVPQLRLAAREVRTWLSKTS